LPSAPRWTGRNAGAGIEPALTPNLRLRREYLYDDFGAQD
jgi:opacity protein-like surface antigen